MRQISIRSLLCGTALLLSGLLATAPVLRAETAPQAGEASQSFDSDMVSTFSGAFLAARTADVDRDFATATELYKMALDFEPDNIDVKQRLMITLLMNGDFDEGIAIADTLKNDPAVERITTIARAMDAFRNKDYDGARALLRYDGPNDLDRLMNGLLLGWALQGEGKIDEALKTVAALEGPEWFDIFKNYQSGALAIAAGDVNTARTFLNSAVVDQNGGRTAPDTFMRAVTALAILEAEAGNRQKALDAVAVGEELVTNYAPLGALRSAIEAGKLPAQQVRDASQGAAAVLFSVGGALNRDGAEDIVSLYLQMAATLDPNSADILLMLGGIAETLKKPEQAIALYRRIPETSPMRRLSEMQLSLALAALGKVDEAKSHLQKLIELDPTDLRVYTAYGSVLSDAKDYKTMGEVYDRAVEVIGAVPSRNDWSIFFQRGIAYERQKLWDKAEPSFRKALELSPEQPAVLNYLGYSWVDMNMNLEEGLDMIRRAVELRPGDGYIVDSLGWAYYRMGRFDDAVVELERAAELMAGDPTINDHLGDAYWRVGRKLEAVFQWNKTLALKPEEPEIPKIKAKIESGLAPLEGLTPAAADAAKEGTDKPSVPADAQPGKKS